MDIIIPLPNLSCCTVSPSENDEESLAVKMVPVLDEGSVLEILLNLSSWHSFLSVRGMWMV